MEDARENFIVPKEEERKGACCYQGVLQGRDLLGSSRRRRNETSVHEFFCST